MSKIIKSFDEVKTLIEKLKKNVVSHESGYPYPELKQNMLRDLQVLYVVFEKLQKDVDIWLDKEYDE